ncbi:hypothetical protein L1286_21105 [Pseudoalteromonas sp. SMS1]|uniref:hypothetical protein n=1 Tax=Pseudoalteromonas sp. SMS1 TaxID=2908894 RepID=UPI001F24B9DB|nr:hypothetical protein [Pseudoalteromonas sp. SMS1]MCF2859985.1 hypothetical protein [Pseudoalteromonas sp. SMS1]
MATTKLAQRTLTHKDALLYAVLTCSFILITAIVIWTKTISFRPLIQDLRLVDAVKVADVLDLQKITYYADFKSHMLYVDESHTQAARLALARAGFVFDTPHDGSLNALPIACKALETEQDRQGLRPIYEQPWFMAVLKLIAGTLIILVFILAVVRPALKALINGTSQNTQ